MGKTHRKVNAGSCSVDYHSPHNRGFAKEEKAYSHHKIRTQNRSSIGNSIEDNIETFNCKQKKMNCHWAASYYGKQCNIPNMHGLYTNDTELHNDYDYKWAKTETNQVDTFNKILGDNCNDNDIKTKYIKASKKQLERRGTNEPFYGHR